MYKTIVKSSVILSTFLQVGCGKAVINKAPASDNNSAIQFITADSFKLSVNIDESGTSSDSSKSFEKDLEVRIPASLNVKEGNAGDGKALIYFNSNTESDYDFYCKYIGGASSETPTEEDEIVKGLKYNFDECYTQDNDQGQIGFNPGDAVTQYNNSSVVFRVESADPTENTTVEAIIDIDWH
jgi:hypothetical protein